MFKYFNLNEVNFQFKIDSLAKEREYIYNEFSKNKENITDGFQKLTSTAIHYPLYRLKENIEDLEIDALARVNVLKPRTFNFKKNMSSIEITNECLNLISGMTMGSKEYSEFLKTQK